MKQKPNVGGNFSSRCLDAGLVMLLAGMCSLSAQAAECNSEIGRSVDPTPLINGWGIDAKNHRFISASQTGISPDALQTLKIKWVFALPDTDAPRSQPLITPDTIIIGDKPGVVYALDRETGCEKWRFDAGSMVRTAFRYIRSNDRHMVTFGTLNAELFALDLLTGKQLWRIQADDHKQAMLSGSSVDHEGVIYQPVSSWELFWALNPFHGCCTFRSSVVAVEAATGEILWRAFTIEEESKSVQKRWLLPDRMGPSGAPVWSQPTLDVKRERLYVGTGENYSSPATDTSDAIIAFDLKNGDMLWKQQFLAGDAWNTSCELPIDYNCPAERGEDLDFGAPPILVTVDNKDYVLAGQKNGKIFALDPDDGGKLLWEQKPGSGGKAGGIHFAMAVDAQRGIMYVPISDRPVKFIKDNPQGTPNPSVQAFDIKSGTRIWKTAAPGNCLENTDSKDNGKPLKGCYPGFSAAPTATEDLLFAPSLDGFIRAFDAETGKQLWAYDTRKEYSAVNGGSANGGSIDLGGVYLDGGQLFLSSGYGLVGQMPGNAFIVMEATAR